MCVCSCVLMCLSLSVCVFLYSCVFETVCVFACLFVCAGACSEHKASDICHGPDFSCWCGEAAASWKDGPGPTCCSSWLSEEPENSPTINLQMAQRSEMTHVPGGEGLNPGPGTQMSEQSGPKSNRICVALQKHRLVQQSTKRDIIPTAEHRTSSSLAASR